MGPELNVRVAAAVAVALAAGCGRVPLDEPVLISGEGGDSGAGLAGAGGHTFTPARKVDMLFVIDDSAETTSLQANLTRNFPVLLNTLRSSPRGLPDLRIAVISTDMGAGDGSISSCDATGGKNGIFQYTPRGDCTSTGLASGATYIADNGTVRNYTGNMADVFACITALGEQGCGFEHQFAAMLRALGADGKPPPAENQGFLRDDAFLFVLIVTNEDDCSAPAASFYDALMNDSLASPLGPVANFRCNEFGHLCNGQKPPRLAPTGSLTDTVTLDECVSAEAAGMLTSVGDVVFALRSVKPFPDQQIIVAAVAGPPTPYTVKWRLPRPGVVDTGPWPEIAHSCTGSESFGDPAVRIGDWTRAFGANGLFVSDCDTDFAPAFQRLGDVLPQQ
jgi:hypothetical protein